MVVKVYMSHISANMEIKKQQEVINRILLGKKIEFEQIDISDPANEEQKNFMRANSKIKQEGRVPLPPQVFNEAEYCGDYEDFHEANECEQLFEFLKMAPPKHVASAQVAFTEEDGENEEKKDPEKEVQQEEQQDSGAEVTNDDEEPSAENGDNEDAGN